MQMTQEFLRGKPLTQRADVKTTRLETSNCKSIIQKYNK